MNRADKLRRVIPGAADELIAALAAKPAAEVDLVVAACRQARRDGLQHEADKRRQAKADARRYRHHDAGELAARNVRMVRASARRAADGDLDELAGLAEIGRLVDAVTHTIVDRMRAKGYPDSLIGECLGVTKQAVQKRFPRQPSLSAESRE